MKTPNRSSDTPHASHSDILKIDAKPHPFSFKEDPTNPLNAQIVEAVNRMGGVGEGAEGDYQKALAPLREKATQAIQIVWREYRALPVGQYLDRWSLVQILAELKATDSLPYLDEILAAPIPPESSKDPHLFSTAGEEVMIRTTAVEAVARMAAAGDARARDLLLKHTKHDNFSVKHACVQSYLEHGGSDARKKLMDTVPEKDRHILDIRRADVRQVPQAEGGLFQVHRDQDEVPPLLPPKGTPGENR